MSGMHNTTYVIENSNLYRNVFIHGAIQAQQYNGKCRPNRRPRGVWSLLSPIKYGFNDVVSSMLKISELNYFYARVNEEEMVKYFLDSFFNDSKYVLFHILKEPSSRCDMLAYRSAPTVSSAI